jgi:hypothetical protein
VVAIGSTELALASWERSLSVSACYGGGGEQRNATVVPRGPAIHHVGRAPERLGLLLLTVGASINCSRAAAVPSFTRGLTLRSSGPAPARHLGRDALAVYHAHRGQGASLARAAQLIR